MSAILDAVRRAAPRPGDLIPDPGPERALAAAVFVNNFGTGLFYVVGVIYLVRSAGLPTHEVGLGLTVAGLLALTAGVPVGMLADRFDPRRVAVGFLLAEALAMVAFVQIRSITTFILAALLSAIAELGSRTVRGVLIGRIGGDRRVALRARLRALSNLSLSAGGLVAGIAVQLDNRFAYQATISLNALTFVAAAVLIGWRLPAFEPIARPRDASALGALRDHRFVLITMLNGAMSMHYGVLSVMLPLWITESTAAPRWAVSGVLVLNTVMVVAFQVSASRGVTDAHNALVWFRRSGMAFLASCAALVLTPHLGTVAVLIALLVIAVVYTIGEMWHAASSFELSYAMAPDHELGSYQGLFAIGGGIGAALAPALLTTVAPLGNGWGWALVGAMFALLGIITGLVRPGHPTATEQRTTV